jgi:hypothetical protein
MNPFEIFLEMNKADTANGTQNLGVFTTCLGADKIKGGTSVKIGCHEGAIVQIAYNEVIPILLWVN